MNKELKKKWVSELRSGKYKQGKGLLRSGDKHCCLGVFCEIAAAAGVGKWIQLVDRLYFNDGKDDGLSLLPSGVMDFGGITHRDPIVVYRGEDRTLSDLNDKGLTFDEIADIIEEQL